MDMIERVARAICRVAGGDPDNMIPGMVVTYMGTMGFSATFDGPLEPQWHSYRAKARAAIEAMRETPECLGKINGSVNWPKMIDAILTASPASK